MVDRYPGKAGRSEYGGGDGVVQRYSDGSSLELPGIASAAGEQAMLMRIAGARDFDPARVDLVGAALTEVDVAQMSAAELEAYQLDIALSARRAAERQELSDKTNGYILEPDQWVGEDASGGAGVTIDAVGTNADPNVGPSGPVRGA